MLNVDLLAIQVLYAIASLAPISAGLAIISAWCGSSISPLGKFWCSAAMRLRERSCTSDGRCTRPRCRIQSEEWVAALCAHGAERDWIHVKTQLL